MLSTSEWEIMNKLILLIYSEDNSYSMRKTFLKNLWTLIDYDAAEFSLINSDFRLYNSVELNMISDKSIGLADLYNSFKDKYGQESTDFFMHYPESVIACALTTRHGAETFANSRFNTHFLKSIDMKYGCTVSFKHEDTLLAEMSLYYHGGSDFSEKDIYILRQLMDHLTNRLAQFHLSKPGVQLSEPQVEHLHQCELTDREMQICELLLSDLPNVSIANELFISPNTLKKHTSNLYKKLDVSSRNELKQLLKIVGNS
ncbi:MAG: helix-turn-helix transcriptional regulator [Bacillota bacterium]|nr:helix-turn-helix transcriptional regulator [Bacillota bacterium]